MTFEVSDVEVISASKGSDDLFSQEDLSTLRENRLLRSALIRKLTPNEKIPDDKADKALLIQLLNGSDAEIIARARLKVAAKSDETNANLANLVGQAMKNFKFPVKTQPTEADFVIPSHIAIPPPVPGQMDIGTVPLTLADLADD